MSKDPTRAEIAMHLMAAVASNPSFTNSADVLADIAVNAADTLLAALGQSGESVETQNLQDELALLRQRLKEVTAQRDSAVKASQANADARYDQGLEDAAGLLEQEARSSMFRANEKPTPSMFSTWDGLAGLEQAFADRIRAKKSKS